MAAILFQTHHKKAGFSEKDSVAGEIEGSRKGGGAYWRWTDSIKKAPGVSVQDLIRTVEDRTVWTSVIHRIAGCQS